MGIINGTSDETNLQIESDTIVVAFVLGFVATRITLLQPVMFTYDPPEEAGADDKVRLGTTVMGKLTRALRAGGFDPASIGGLHAVYAPSHSVKKLDRDSADVWKDMSESFTLQDWQPLFDKDKFDIQATEHYAITGGWGGRRNEGMSGDVQTGTYLDRQRRMSDKQVLYEVRQVLGGLWGSEEQGAYYGVVDDPVTQQGGFVASSVRRIISYTGAEGLRWRRNQAYHGLILGERGRTIPAQQGSFESPSLISAWPGANGIVGYCHGMTWAIQHAKQIGPWATPYELGVGQNTKKLASCMGCTSFMYATGYPPSASHLGSAESWVPLPPAGRDNPHHSSISDQLNALWAKDMADYLALGARILASATVVDGVKGLASQLGAAVRHRVNTSHLDAANLYLDASTVHKNDTKRIDSILG